MEQIILNLKNQLSLSSIMLYRYDTLPSTNSYAWELLSHQISPPFVVIAKQQTAGKGQRGNIWRSSLGGLYLTIVLDFDHSIDLANHIPLWTIHGVVTSLNQWSIPVKIKWLNDVILAEKKLGGILCETRIEKKRIKTVMIGIGINYENNYPLKGINLKDYCHSQNIKCVSSIEELEKIVITGIINSYDKYFRVGIENIVNEYNYYLYNRDEKVMIEDNLGDILGINNEGELLVKIRSSNASSKIKLSPLDYSISYEKLSHNCYFIREKGT